MAAQREVFEDVGFETVSEEIVIQQVAPDYAAYSEKIALKADSILIRLSNKDFEAGMEALRSYASRSEGQRPVSEPIDLIVFQKQ